MDESRALYGHFLSPCCIFDYSLGNGGATCIHCLKRNLSCTYVEPAAVRFRYNNRTVLPEDPSPAPLRQVDIAPRAMPAAVPHHYSNSPRPRSTDPIVFPAPHTSFGLARDSSPDRAVQPEFWPRDHTDNSSPSQHQSLTLDGCFSFPDHQFMWTLVSLYFENVNPFIPLLHRPTFENSLNQKHQVHDKAFASTLLLVCAIGSVYLPEPNHEMLGWQWYNQVELDSHFLQKPSLHDIQTYCLVALFLAHSSNSRTCLTIVGYGLQLAKNVIADREMDGSPRDADEDLMNRAVSILVLFDTQFRGALGRSAVSFIPEIDMILPSESDDEVAFLNSFLNLHSILRCALRFSCNTTQSGTTEGRRDVTKTVSELNSRLNSWFSSIQQHFKWDQFRQDEIVFDQSAALHSCYYYTRILIHRPFITVTGSNAFEVGGAGLIPAEDSGLIVGQGIPAVEACNNAARACAQISEIQRRRRPNNPLLFSPGPVSASATVLILNMWNTGKTLQDIRYIHTCLDVLQAQKQKWPSSGAFFSTVKQLVPAEILSAYDFQPAQDYDSAGDSSHPSPRDGLDVIPPALVGDEDIGAKGLHQFHSGYWRGPCRLDISP
ncbi:Zn(2)-C6 fungal-type domain-containing protein [Mycena venus]|uniref:Zn(2)-C6 fungal-type domain-containing protein n=1 Tax=Mycena venus TaxID=2733690 RepID=A0A8H6Z1T7_9AGAR|nr:Zn(2)-C6 fungal-type domain-containing protein [Mycena venus]